MGGRRGEGDAHNAALAARNDANENMILQLNATVCVCVVCVCTVCTFKSAMLVLCTERVVAVLCRERVMAVLAGSRRRCCAAAAHAVRQAVCCVR